MKVDRSVSGDHQKKKNPLSVESGSLVLGGDFFWCAGAAMLLEAIGDAPALKIIRGHFYLDAIT